MPKITKKDSDSSHAKMSDEMIKNCKSKIAKFGFGPKEYKEFLKSVNAISNNGSIYVYRNEDLNNYRELYLKDLEYSVGDALQIDRFKILSSDNNGNVYETGYFAPRSFWDKIMGFYI